ncbi:hypothetical protein C8Q77DRAFT_238589 [Trametes polyzona]|nr:hypothetical protein C8Q77DRAFT_238589 [Trametes polyzona]
MQACSADPSGMSQCKCNTVTYNVHAACAACSGDGPPSWAQWADDQDCASNPLQFPADVDIGHRLIPEWAYQPLTKDNEFNMSAAVLQASGLNGNSLSAGSEDTDSNRRNVAAQVAVPIAAGVGVAIVATTICWLYWRRKYRHHDPRTKTLPLIPGAKSTFWRPWLWFYTLWPGARSRRLRPLKKDSDWAIDEDVEGDTEWLGSKHSRARSAASYVDPYNLVQSPTGGAPLELEDLPHTSAHIQETSSSLLLPLRHIDFPDVRVPTIFERFIKSKDGVRKSPAYKSKYVSEVSPDPQFRIDDSAGPTPVAKDFAAESSVGSSFGRSVGANKSQTALGRSEGEVTERSDFEPQQQQQVYGSGSSVLLISRDGRDFTIDDTTTSLSHSHSHPSSPLAPSSFRQDSISAASRAGTMTGTGSWLPSPNRANTSSTNSGAWPSELRRDPDLTSPRSWAPRFPAPPSAFTQSPTQPPVAFRSFSGQAGGGPLPDYTRGS